jgi:hypothetical protein
MNGLDFLGAEVLPKPAPLTWGRTTLALMSGVVGAIFFRKHPVLAFLNAGALASNIHAVATGDRSVKNAIKRMGRHLVSTAGSLALPNHPAMGYVAGAVAADLLIDDEGGGIIDEWADYEGISRSRQQQRQDVIDAEFIETPQKALVKR